MQESHLKFKVQCSENDAVEEKDGIQHVADDGVAKVWGLCKGAKDAITEGGHSRIS